MTSPSSLSSQVVVVTGSSSGIGRATAIAFAKQGANVLVHGRSNFAGAEETCEGVRRLQNARFKPIAPPKTLIHMCDLSNPEESATLVEQAFGWFGHVDAWVHCAGADVITEGMRELSFGEKLERLWRVDVEGMIRLSRLVAARMLAQPKRPYLPGMIHIGWDQASHGVEGDSGEYFCAVKGAIAAFSKSFAKTLAPRIRVNCIAPGWTRTEWGEKVDETWAARAIGESQLNRWGTPEDIAGAIVALSSPECQFIHGQVIPVNGGWKSMNLSPKCPSSIEM